ncbi:HAD family hydrolase [Flavobacterium sp.]|uniref:HAD family hydrolase n=1 Tax=Flavobacterium sp. TaxID=239 RepID=UPI002FD91291
MINTLIFDFGDIFINLNKNAIDASFRNLGLSEWNSKLQKLNAAFEIGKISELEFLEGIQTQIPHASLEEIRTAWNSILGDFPLYRLEFLQSLKGKYRLFLLSNTDKIHIDKFEHQVGLTFSRDFYNGFEKVYFSFELGKRKPNPEIFAYLIQKHDLSPKRTLFIDDKEENTNAAKALGLEVWNLQVGKEDVIELSSKLRLTL